MNIRGFIVSIGVFVVRALSCGVVMGDLMLVGNAISR
jgi:hypothetical protein